MLRLEGILFLILYEYTTHATCSSAPVHIVTGSAGCQEGRDHFLNTEPKWSAFRSQDFGYTKLKVYNHTHAYAEQVSVDLGGAVIDSFWLIKDKPLPGFAEL